MFFLTDGFYFLYSILAIDIFIVLFTLFLTLLSILRLHNRANILGMLLIMLLSHVEIHICHY
jgi:hypothetical protein